MLSLALGASLASQTQPTPPRIAFRILKLSTLGVIESGLLKAVHWVGSGLWDYVRGYQVYKEFQSQNV